MDTTVDHFTSEKLFPNSNLLDLEDLNESDFLGNMHFSEQMEEFSNELFSSFFDDHLLSERNPLLDMELDPPNPAIQEEHSYSLSGDSAPQSPTMPIQMDKESEGLWSLGQDLTAVLVKQEPSLLTEPSSSTALLDSAPHQLNLAIPALKEPQEDMGSSKHIPLPAIKTEPNEANSSLNTSPDERLQLPPTPPSSHGSDSDGSQSPRSLPPPSPARQPTRTSAAISTSPLLTAPHKLQGTSGPLMLTEEEKRTLIAEGYPVPNKLPLTKTEEKALKRVRRKIKNKISAQESRRKKKEYVECLEKKVETYTSENNELWKKVETLEGTNRSLLQQLQKLQSLVAGKVPQFCKIASTQTGTCLMVVLLCFVLVLGSFMPGLSEVSSMSHMVKSSPLPPADIYTASHIRSRSLLFYDEASPLEEPYSGFLKMEDASEWDGASRSFTKEQPATAPHGEHETSKYLDKVHTDLVDLNRTETNFLGDKEEYHERKAKPTGSTEYF
ncbi:cyclic AMP-responsive element-binding protein 3-like protein 1 isoform X1 [Paramormyrops kingsleyae]|uniref:cAMP responsive element binding protein 3 like 1 n=1 Tax=Paramormyrops kingsleyae TaxID=1676925 RepID=A0A3B3RGZ3_9TELE|nr:cyclic AMP-responsive element-binding protein 3-like protein 1 [Paramormyrops kingsleyae]